MVNQVNRIPLPSQLLVDPKTGVIDQYWYDFLSGFKNTDLTDVEDRLTDIETRLDALEAQSLFRAPTNPTRMWIDIVAGNDANDGLTAATAKQHPQAAINHVIQHWHLNDNGVEFFYRWRDDVGGNPIEYPGAIWAYPFLGAPHDFAIRVTGEKDGGGSVRVRIADGGSGCIHAAEGAQIYVSDIAVRSFAGASTLVAAYNGKLFLDNVVIYTGGGAMIEAGPRNGSIDVLGNITISSFASAMSSVALTNAMDGGAISSAAGKTWLFNGSPQFSFGILNGSYRGRQELRHTWSGGAIGRKWTLQSDGLFLTAGGPGAAALDAWVPGSTNGAILDGGTWPIL